MSAHPLLQKISVFSLLLAVSPALLAETELHWFAGVDATYHDNLALVPNHTQSDTDLAPQTHLTIDRTDDPLRLNLNYSVVRHHFTNNVQTDRTVWTGNARAVWDALPQRLQFQLSHNVSEQQQSRRSADTIDSRERVSILTAAATGFLHPSPVDTISLTPRFTDVRLQQTGSSDSRHAAADLAWQHALSPISTLTLSASHDRVTFDTSQDDYQYDNALLSYGTRLARLTYSIAGGFNRIRRDHYSNTSGYQVSIGADYLGSETSWGGSLVRRLSDATLGLRGGTGTPSVGFNASGSAALPSDGNVGQFDIVEINQVEVHALRHFGPLTQVHARAAYLRENYQTTPRDEKSWSVGLGASQRVRRFWSVGIDAAFTNTDFIDTPAYRQRDTDIRLFANWHPGERLTTHFDIGQRRRSSDNAANDYTDHFATVGFEYRIY